MTYCNISCSKGTEMTQKYILSVFSVTDSNMLFLRDEWKD